MNFWFCPLSVFLDVVLFSMTDWGLGRFSYFHYQEINDILCTPTRSAVCLEFILLIYNILMIIIFCSRICFSRDFVYTCDTLFRVYFMLSTSGIWPLTDQLLLYVFPWFIQLQWFNNKTILSHCYSIIYLLLFYTYQWEISSRFS